jgi:hypothetical protein
VVRRSPSKVSYVTVVANNPQTLEDLYSYFTQVGVTSNGTRELDAAALTPAGGTALVLFPDEFEQADVEAAILALRRARPKLLIVPRVLPKPAFGWTILDAIQGRADRSPS